MWYGYSNEHTFYALSRWRHFVDLWNDHRQLDLHIATPQQRLRFNDDNSNEPWHMWGPRYPLSVPLKLPKILMKSVVCIALAGNDLFSGFLINSRPTSGLRLRLASPCLATALSRLDLTIVCRSRFVSASDGSAVIIILLFALRLRSEVLDAYFVAWYICSFYSIQTQRNSRACAHILAFNKKLALKRRVERDLCAALASCCLGILLVWLCYMYIRKYLYIRYVYGKIVCG